MTELPDELRALLNLARDGHEPNDPEARTRVRGAIAASLLLTGGAASSSLFPEAVASNTQTLGASLEASKLGWTVLGGKVSTLVVGAVAAVGLTFAALSFSRPTAPVTPPVLQQAASVAPARAESPAAVLPSGVPAQADQPAAAAGVDAVDAVDPPVKSSKPRAARNAQTMAAETALLRSASQALARGDESAAIELLREHGRRFPDGSLREERDGLRAIAECSRADLPSSARAATARRFVRQYPSSLLGARVAKACAGE